MCKPPLLATAREYRTAEFVWTPARPAAGGLTLTELVRVVEGVALACENRDIDKE